MVQQFIRVRIVGAARELDGIFDFRADFFFDFFQRAFVHALLEQTGARSGDGALWQPVVKLVLALHARVQIHGPADVAPPAAGAAFAQRGASACPRAAYRTRGSVADTGDL